MRPPPLVDNAGMHLPGRVRDAVRRRVAGHHGRKLLGAVRMAKPLLPDMIGAGQGSTVNLASAGREVGVALSEPLQRVEALRSRGDPLPGARDGQGGCRVSVVSPALVDPLLLLDSSDLCEVYGVSVDGLRDIAGSRSPIGRLTTPEDETHIGRLPGRSPHATGDEAGPLHQRWPAVHLWRA